MIQDQQLKNDILDLIDARLKTAVVKKTGDTPLEEYDLVNKKYVDSNAVGISGKLTMGGNQSINSGNETLVNFDTSGFTPIGITVDATNKKMTILTAGKYLITVKLVYSATVDNKSYQLRIKKNGTTNISISWATSSVVLGTYYSQIVVSDVFNLAVNDYIEIYAYHIAGVAQNIGVTGSEYFTITKK